MITEAKIDKNIELSMVGSNKLSASTNFSVPFLKDWAKSMKNGKPIENMNHTMRVIVPKRVFEL